MEPTNTPCPNDFEFAIFELLTEDGLVNTNYFNHQLAKLYAKYASMAKKMVRDYHLDMEYSSDILQDSIVILLQRIRDGKFTYNHQYRFKSFLYKTMENLVMNQLKSQRFDYSDESLENINSAEEASEMELFEYQMAPSCTLEEKTDSLLREKLGKQAAKVLKISLIDNKTDQEGAEIMGYKNGRLFGQKKSQHLITFRSRIDPVTKNSLYRHHLAG